MGKGGKGILFEIQMTRPARECSGGVCPLQHQFLSLRGHLENKRVLKVYNRSNRLNKCGCSSADPLHFPRTACPTPRAWIHGEHARGWFQSSSKSTLDSRFCCSGAKALAQKDADAGSRSASVRDFIKEGSNTPLHSASCALSCDNFFCSAPCPRVPHSEIMCLRRL